MRSLLAALAVTLVAAAPAAADYTRVPGPVPDDDLVLARGEVIVGAGSNLTFGGSRTVPLPGGPRLVEEINVSSTAATLLAIHGSGNMRAYYGPLAGPYRRFSEGWIDVAVSGSRVMAAYRGSMRVIDLRTGLRRRFAIAREPRVIAAAGRYFAYATGRRYALVVHSLDTGREVYRVTTGGYVTYGLAPGGRLVVVSGWPQPTIRTATPGDPKLRVLRRTGLGSLDLAVGRDGVLIGHGDARARTEVALLRWNGRITPVTPLLPQVGALAWDGKRVAFVVGTCVFTGPVGDATTPVDTEGVRLMGARVFVLAVVVALLGASPADADYRRVPGPPMDWFTLGGGDLFTIAEGTLTAHAPDGTQRRIAVPKSRYRAGYVTASDAGVSVSIGTRQFYRANGGTWKRAPGRYPTVRVSGSRVTSLYSDAEDRGGAIRIISLRTGKQRRYRIRDERPQGGHVLGRYFAYLVNGATRRETVVVRSVATGREVYRVAPGRVVNFELLSGGRLAVVTLGAVEHSYR